MDEIASTTIDAIAYGQAVWSCRLDAGGKLVEMIDMRRWLTSPTHRGEHGAAVKTIAQGMPMFGLFLWRLCWWVFFTLPTGLRVQLNTRHSLRPLPEGRRCCKNSDANRAAGMLLHVFNCRPGQASDSERDPGPITTGPYCCEGWES
jgi:hypothetical protein